MNCIFILGQPDIFQRMGQIFQKCCLRFCGKRFHPQCPGIDLFLCNHRLPLCFHILNQFVQIIILISPVQPLHLSVICQYNQPVLRTGGCHIDQLLIIFQPHIGSLPRIFGEGCGKKNDILLISLKCVNGSTGKIGKLRFLRRLLNGLPLIDERSNDSDILLPVLLRIGKNLPHLCH